MPPHRRAFSKATTQILCLTICCAGILLADPVPEASDREPLTILAYNIKHGRGMDGVVDLNRSAALINKLKPHLVALQEVDHQTERTSKIDQAKALGELTGMHHAFGPFFDFQGGQYGMAILSGQKPTEIINHRLPDGSEPRTALAISVTPMPEAPEIVFIGLHFYASREQRLAQAQKVLEILETEKRPVILAGDYNSRPGGEVLKLFSDEWTIPDKGSDHLTFPSDKPRSEIDFIMFRGLDDWKIVKIDVLEEPLISDHRPVLLKLMPSPSAKSDD